MLSGIGGHLPEIIIVLVVILIIWGPGKLPDVGAALGKGIREFRKASSDVHDVGDEVRHDHSGGTCPGGADDAGGVSCSHRCTG